MILLPAAAGILKPSVYPASMVFLSHFDGTNGSTTFVDERGHSISSASGSPTLSTADKQFGSASLSLTPTQAVEVTSTSDFTISQQYTIECWAKWTETSNFERFIATLRDDSSGKNIRLSLVWVNSTTLKFKVYSHGTSWTTPDIAGLPSSWHHYAACLNASNKLGLYVDGVLQATQTYTTETLTSPRFVIGANWTGSSYLAGFKGFIDEFRFDTTARYDNVNNFTPQTSPY